MNRATWGTIIAICGVAALAGSFLPWASDDVFSLSGWSGDGLLTAPVGLGLLLLGLAISRQPVTGSHVVAGVLGGILLAIVLIDGQKLLDRLNWAVSPGIGLVAIGIAGLVAVVLAGFPPTTNLSANVNGAPPRGNARPKPVAVILAAAAGMTLLVGADSTIAGGGHLGGVIVTASNGVYRSYDFRLAALLIIGILMVVAGTLSIAAASGLARGQRRAWDRAMSGTVLLLLVTVPLAYVPNAQGELAATLAFLTAPNLIVLVVARVIARRWLEAG